MPGLSYFKGKKSDPAAASAAAASGPHKSPGTRRNPTTTAASPPPGSCSPLNDVYRPAPSAPPFIPVATPVAYIPPSAAGGAMSPTDGQASLDRQQQQHQHQKNPSSWQWQQQQQQQQGTFPTTTIGNDEIDHNLRLLHTAALGGQRTLPHRMFLMLSIVTALTGLNNVVAHLLALLFYGKYENGTEVVLRYYTIGLCLVVILIETDQTALVRQSLVFRHFATRGVFYSFLGVLGLVEYDIGNQNSSRYRQYGFFGTNSGGSSRLTLTLPTAEGAGEVYIWMTSSLMAAVGIVYLVLGTFCLHQKLDEIRRDYHQRMYESGASATKGGSRHYPHAPIV